MSGPGIGNHRVGQDRGVTYRQESAALLLASGASVAETARKTKVAEPTVWVWLRLPAFKDRVRELRRDLTERAAGVLAAGMTEASWTLRQLLKSKSETVRLKAAEALLAHGREQTGLAELQADVEELKAARAPHRNGRVA
jgi:transposase-like protein